MISQCTKFEVSRFIRYDAMNSGAKCRKWGSLGQLGRTEGHQQFHHYAMLYKKVQKLNWNEPYSSSSFAYDFLFDFNRNHASILYRFRDIAGYLSEIADFDPPHLYLVPP